MQTPDHKKPATPPPTPAGAPKGPPPGVPATTAATTTSTNGTQASTANNDKQNENENDENEGSDETKETNRSKFYVVVGEVHEFPTAAKAEAYLNHPSGPKQFSVIRGHKVESKQKVTLR